MAVLQDHNLGDQGHLQAPLLPMMMRMNPSQCQVEREQKVLRAAHHFLVEAELCSYLASGFLSTVPSAGQMHPRERTGKEDSSGCFFCISTMQNVTFLKDVEYWMQEEDSHFFIFVCTFSGWGKRRRCGPQRGLL